MLRNFGWLLLTGALWAQQQIVPAELVGTQRELFEKLTVAVSAPCCKNGIPVAFHESEMANEIRVFIKDAILAGKNEAQITHELGELRFGAERLAIVFTVPESNSLGFMAWFTPVIVIVLGAIGMATFLKRRARTGVSIGDEELLATYGEAIRAQVAAKR